MLGYKYITRGAINMKQDILHYPNLKTVLEVEEIIKNSEMPLTRYKILQKLKKKTMKQTLNVIINYLDDKGIIYDSKKGIFWAHQPKEKLDIRMKNGLKK